MWTATLLFLGAVLLAGSASAGSAEAGSCPQVTEDPRLQEVDKRPAPLRDLPPQNPASSGDDDLPDKPTLIAPHADGGRPTFLQWLRNSLRLLSPVRND